MEIFFNHLGLVGFSQETAAYLAEKLPAFSFTFAPEVNKNAEVLVSYPFTLTNEYLATFPRLKVIQLLSVGYDNLDLTYLKKRGIRLMNAQATSHNAISEFLIGQILSFNYNFPVYHAQQSEKLWKRHYKAIELSGHSALILGAGAIGQATAKRLEAFGVKLTTYRRKEVETPYFCRVLTTISEVKEELPTFDYVILALPSSPETLNLINKDWLSLMKESALLINVARGDLIVEEDLISALNEEKIRGAILDVTRLEPLPSDSPLWNTKNLVLTPHIAYFSDHYLGNVLNLITKNFERLINNQTIKTEISL